jgi:hypothetical protein
MIRRTSSRNEQLRYALAQEAARIMFDQGIEDFLLAKRKAAERLGVSDAAALPRNAEIESALIDYQRLFHSQQHAESLSKLRHCALQVMRLLETFQPRLVGPVLAGTATAHSEITLHAFADHAERVSLLLDEKGIDHHHAEKKLRYESERQISFPSFKFVAGNHAVEVVTLPLDGLRQSPLSPVDGKPMHRATRAEVEALVE